MKPLTSLDLNKCIDAWLLELTGRVIRRLSELPGLLSIHCINSSELYKGYYKVITNWMQR